MMQRLNQDAVHPRKDVTGKGSALFVSRLSLRKLRVLIDADLLKSLGTPEITGDLLLAGLLTHPLISLHRYADDGPPSDLSPRDYNTWTKAYEGWATVDPPDPQTGTRAVVYADEDSVTHAGLIEDIAEFASQDTRTNTYGDLPPKQAASRRQADAVAAQVASSIGADLYITDRPFLHQAGRAYTRDITVLAASDALPFISLYLRAQGEFVTYRDLDGRGTFRMNRGLFYWVGTRELLPSAWRWFGACVMESHAVGDSTLTYLGQSALQRVQRALTTRDTVHCMINQPQNNDIADDVLSNLDVIFVLLMGAVDATARVAHVVLGLSPSKNKVRKAGWQNSEWLKLVRAEDANLADVVADGSSGQQVLTILRALRNSVHGEALQSLAVQHTGRRETLVGLPQADMDELMKACEALGGSARWGIKRQIPGRMHADPHVLLEELFPRVVDLLDLLMARTPVERLPHVEVAKLQVGPPVEGPMGTFSENNRNSIRWQLGL